jgi:hypothetical protein
MKQDSIYFLSTVSQVEARLNQRVTSVNSESGTKSVRVITGDCNIVEHAVGKCLANSVIDQGLYWEFMRQTGPGL